MKKSILLLTLPIFFWSCSSKSETTTTETPIAEAQAAPAAEGPALPVFNLNDLNGAAFSTAAMPDNAIIIFFNPGCDHCQREATAIHGRKEDFEDKQVYFISVDSLSTISKFRKEYDLTDPNFHFAAGDVETIVTAMGPVPSVPCIYIYRDRKLVSRLEGEAEIDEILRLAGGN